ncbi:MAG: hypothetical protein OXH68_05975 [Gammaproteobacteria bacterium]|nr:hypothetical protein [Gammaproteobacteria bacterium]
MRPGFLALVLAAGLSAGASPIYDTHETYDAKVEQYSKDYSAWLDRRRATYDAWREGIRNPAVERVGAEKWEEYETNANRECGEKPAEGSDDQGYRQCRDALFDSLLADNHDGYVTLVEYIARHGGDEPKPEYPKYKLKPSPPTEHEMEYERAEQECDDAGGQWITSEHGDGQDFYFNTMRCLKELPPAHDPGWDDQLLPYTISVEYDRRSHKVIEFTRTVRKSP